ncbi:large ribosomal subunit protein mL48-like [Ruditapes philippinarum]|uniref:large ribosomal subunit protein mL48-like n=1 Tax=Ruditapes philippinarum TaxID=129788 RepID=UPI00295B3F02|nr:large ribosomal subunit protein mL48-like [Ruditapes philippinarum]XP_060553121.1 large ribosomal subunit protein mL48-like [Ruditapes philippinarum]XP_060553123.1 large ribosomal subunit protein mL48-like [Ruditapes philippinarum]
MEKFTSVLKLAVSYSRFRSLKTIQKRCLSTSQKLQHKWEPDINLDPEIPEYNTLNIRIQGYDYPCLDFFSKYVYVIAKQMDIDCNRYSVPAKKLEINSLQFKSNVILDTCNLNHYERVIQLYSLPSTKLQVLMEMVWSCVPEGVNITLKENTDEDVEMRYIPDHQKLKIEEMIQDIESRQIKK